MNIFVRTILLGLISLLQGFTAEDKIVTIYLIGDSTMADYSNDYEPGKDYMKTRYPLMGWGQVFQQFVASDSLPLIKGVITADSVRVVNRARGGRSTRTFFQEGRWRAVYNELKKGDVVIMQFGHNDASQEKAERYVNIEGYKEFLRLFISQSREKGALPVVLTPVARNYPWENGVLENVHGDYDHAAKEVAVEMEVPLVDLNKLSRDLFTAKGRDFVESNYFMNLPAGLYEAYPDGQKDNTHFQPQGAKVVASLVFDGLKELAMKSLKHTPYSIQTTYEKLKKNYPDIVPISEIRSEKISTKENVVYKTCIDGRTLELDIYAPAKGDMVYPSVLLVHGGGWISGSKENQRVMAQNLALNGYVAVTAAYSLSADASYPAAVTDLKDALRWMREHASELNIDSNRIAVLGASAGAQLATLVGVTSGTAKYDPYHSVYSDSVQAIINIDGVVSFIHPEAEEGIYAGKWLGGSKSTNYASWKEASPLEYVNASTPPVLFINSSELRFHAGRDDMIRLLEQQNIYNEVQTIEGSPHSFWLLNPWFKLTLRYVVNFLDKVLSK